MFMLMGKKVPDCGNIMTKSGSFVEMWMDLESVIQSEVSQKEKNKYRILTHVCGI